MSIEEAFCKSKNEILTLEKISKDPNFNDIKNDLYCSTPNCPAKLVYVRAKNPYLRILPNDNHSENCIEVFERNAVRTRREKVGTIDADLDENDFSTRHSYYLKKFLEENKPKDSENQKSKRKNKRKPNPIDKTGPAETYEEVKIATDGASETIEELKSRGIIAKAPRIPEKKLNQLNQQDIGSLAGTMLKVESLKKLREQNYEMIVSSSGKKASLILPESFFTTQYIEAEKYINSIGSYLDDKRNGKIPFDLFLATNFSIAKLSEVEIELQVLQYKWLSIVILNRNPRKLKLSQFYANYTRGNYSN